MAISDVTLVWSSESASLSKELDFDSTGEAGYVEVYDCIGAASDDSLDVRTATNVPQLGDQKGSENLWVTSVNIVRTGLVHWTITVTYSSFGGIDPEDPTADPLLMPAKVKWSTVKTEGEIDEDADGEPIVTTAGEPVLGIKRPFSDLKATITKTFSSFTPWNFYQYIDSVNTDEFLGFPPGTAKVDDISADEQTFVVSATQVTYYAVTAVVIFRRPIRTTPDKAWYNRRVEKGMYVKNTSGDLVPAQIAGANSPTPVFLDADGEQTTKDNAIWSEDKLFDEIEFEGMGFF